MYVIERIKSYYYRKKYGLLKLGVRSQINEVIFEGRNALFSDTLLSHCYIGQCTYVSRNCNLVNTKIGRFCSIANNVHTCNGQHPTSTFVTTFPSFYYNTENQIGFTFHKEAPLFNTSRLVSGSKEYEVIIGNDVWIGSHVLIMSGVSIGDGAVVAAGSVVTKNVDPYTIVGGVPAKIIKRRFNEEQIRDLLNIQWWNKPLEEIENKYKYFEDIENFLMQYV